MSEKRYIFIVIRQLLFSDSIQFTNDKKKYLYASFALGSVIGVIIAKIIPGVLKKLFIDMKQRKIAYNIRF